MKPPVKTIILACLAVRGAFGAEPAKPIQDLILDDHTVYSVPVAANRVTTINFPSAISAIDAALVTTDAKSAGLFQIAHTKGTSYLSARALAKDATTNLNVRWNGRTYVIELRENSAGLRGRLIKRDDLAEIKMFAAALLSGAAEAFTTKQTSAFGSFAVPSLTNAPLQGAQSVLDRYANQIQQSIERDGFYVRVPAGKQFYLYVTQTLDRADAKIGGQPAANVATPGNTPAGAPSTSSVLFRASPELPTALNPRITKPNP